MNYFFYFYEKINFKMKRTVLFIMLLVSVSQGAEINAQQLIGFKVHADPLAGWFGSDNSDIAAKSAKAGFNFGLTFNRYFHGNYAFSTGLSLVTAGGNIAYKDTVTLKLKNPIEVLPKSKLAYSIRYLAIPIGLKLRSNQIGYVSIFTNIGLDPKFILGGKVEVPSRNIAKENADNMLSRLSMGYHVIGGIEYSVGGTSAIVLGIRFDSNFTDITKHPDAKITHKMLGLHLGFNF